MNSNAHGIILLTEQPFAQWCFFLGFNSDPAYSNCPMFNLLDGDSLKRFFHNRVHNSTYFRFNGLYLEQNLHTPNILMLSSTPAIN